MAAGTTCDSWRQLAVRVHRVRSLCVGLGRKGEAQLTVNDAKVCNELN